MTEVKVWLLENITKYDRDDRINFLNDCADENEVCIRYVQKCYKELFKPVNNIGTNLIENNNRELSELYPGKYKDVEDDQEIIEESVRLAKKLQKSRDKSRIERKTFRNYARIENACESLTEALIQSIRECGKPATVFHEENESDCVGIFNLADLHANELVDIPGNKYDFNVAAKRLKKYVIQAKKYFRARNVKHVLVCNLADGLNSDRRPDEILSQATNRAKACFLLAYILEQVILDLNEDFNVTYATVCGNESRLDKEFGEIDHIVTNNYDFIVMNILKIMFEDTDVVFLDGPYDEKVLSVNGKHILIMHGHQFTGANLSKQMQQVKGKYADKGIIIDHIFCGHLHESRVGDFYSRSSSLVGSNAYSDGKLQLTSRAAQLIGFVDEDGIDVMKIDLQKTGDIKGYDIIKKLEEYNAKSVDKLHRKEYVAISEVIS